MLDQVADPAAWDMYQSAAKNDRLLNPTILSSEIRMNQAFQNNLNQVS
jgi:hypothetical protein